MFTGYLQNPVDFGVCPEELVHHPHAEQLRTAVDEFGQVHCDHVEEVLLVGVLYLRIRLHRPAEPQIGSKGD